MPFVLRAQITVTQADFAAIGDNVNQATDTLPVAAILPGAAGANQTWDFSLLHNQKSTVYNFIDVSSTPFASSFPMANIAAMVPGPFYTYLNSSSSSVQIWGFGGDILGDGTQHALVYNNSEKEIVFPCTYNTPINDTSKYDSKYYYGHTIVYGGTPYLIDSVRQNEVNYITDSIDAWGTATTPDGSYPVLRNNSLKHTIDSTWAHVQLYNLWVLYTKTSKNVQSYGFIGNGIKNVLVNIVYYPDSAAIQKVDWTRTTPASINEQNFSDAVIIYPNPTNNNLTIESPPQAVIEITNIQGQLIKTLATTGNKTYIDVSALLGGVYIVEVKTEKGIEVKKFIKE